MNKLYKREMMQCYMPTQMIQAFSKKGFKKYKQKQKETWQNNSANKIL